MEEIRQYILSVVASAIISAIVIGILGKKGSYAQIAKLLCGLFVLITAVSPWVNIQIRERSSFFESIQSDSEEAVRTGERMAHEATAEIIKSQTEAYILDKAAAMGLRLSVEVTLDCAQPPKPESVTIRGSVSPHAKQTLSNYIRNDLGISEDKQLWT